MKNKKLLITSILMMVVGISLIIAGFLDFESVNKLKGDVTGDSEYTASFRCQKTSIAVDETTTCTIVINGGSTPIAGIAGTPTVGENASIGKEDRDVVVIANGWQKLGVDMFFADNENAVTGEAEIYSINLTGVSVGTTTLTMVEFDSALKLYGINEDSYPLTVVDTQIEVTDNSGGVGENVDPSADSDSTLKSLTVSDGTLTPAFNKNTTDYTVNVANNISTITINAETTDPDATIEGTGDYDLDIGANDPISIIVTSITGTEKVYKVTVTRSEDESDIAETDLESLEINNGTLSPSFDKDITYYTIIPDANAVEIGITATAASDTATVSGAGTKKISEITGPIEIEVVDANGNRKVYTLVLKEAKVDTECVLTSEFYGIDNLNLLITKVDLEDSDETITSRIKASCGTIKVSDNKLILTYINGKTKTYVIERSWSPKTGNDRVNYIAIMGGIILLIGAVLFIYNKKQDK